MASLYDLIDGDVMDQYWIEKIDKSLKRYDEEIEEITKNYNETKRLGRYDLYGPYSLKFKIFFMLEYLKNAGVDISSIKVKYEAINIKLTKLEHEKGKDLRDKLYEELKLDISCYPQMINCTFDLDPVCLETENALDGRDAIEILMMELDGEYDLSDLLERVSVLDEELKNKYMRHIKAYLKKCPSIEEPYYPERFWWRHPSKFC